MKLFFCKKYNDDDDEEEHFMVCFYNNKPIDIIKILVKSSASR